MSYGGDRCDVGNAVLGVADRLDVDGPRVLIYSRVELRRVVPDDPFDVYLKFAQVYSKLVERAAIY